MNVKMKLTLLLLMLSQLLFGQMKPGSCTGLGNQMVYSYKMEGISYSDIERLYSNDTTQKGIHFFESKTLKTLQLNFDCVLSKTFLRCTAMGQLYSFLIMNPAFHESNSAPMIDYHALEKEIAKPFFAEIASSGKILSVQFDSTLSYTSVNMVKDFLGRFQFIKVAGNKNKWQTEEESTIGTFIAQYIKVKQKGSLNEFKKINAGFTRINSAQKSQKVNIESNNTYGLDSLENVHEIRISELVITMLGKDTISAYGCRLSINLVSTGQIKEMQINELTNVLFSAEYKKVFSLSTALSAGELNRLVYTNTLSAHDLNSLMKLLSTADGSDKDALENLRIKFRALAYLHPETCEQLGQILEKESRGTPGFIVLSAALAHTETKYAINALANVIYKRIEEPDVVFALLPFLAITKIPTAKAIAVTKELAFEYTGDPLIISTAQLALGGIANNLKNTDPGLSAKLTDYILGKLKFIRDTLHQVYILANTGSPKVFGYLERIIKYDKASVIVRVKAVEALRFIQTAATILLLKKIQKNKDKSLARAATESIQYITKLAAD